MTDESNSDGSNYDDEIQQLWDDQTHDEAHVDARGLAQAMSTAHNKDQKRLWGLVVQETLPAVAVAAYFLWKSTTAPTSLRQGALVAAALIAFGVAGFLIATAVRQRASEQVFGSTLADELERRRSQLTHRAMLYRTVGWWYFAPISVGIVLAYLAGRAPGGVRTFDVGYAAVAIITCAVLYVMNRRVGRNRYEPELASVSSMLTDLTS